MRLVPQLRFSCSGRLHCPNLLQVARFLAHLLTTRFKGTSNPSGALDNVRKAMAHLRTIQRGIPNAHDFSK